NRDALIRAGLNEGRDFTAIDSEAFARPLCRLANVLCANGKGWTALTALMLPSYLYFEKLVYRKFSKRIRAHEFDVVHRVTPLSPTYPSLLAKHCAAADVPFVIGPLNGGVPWPRGFGSVRRQEREWLSYVRGGYRFVPGYHSMRRYASAMIIGSRDTWAQ